MKPTYFASAAAFRAWLEAHGATERELWVGFHRLATGRGGITYPEAVDEALCCGWIDGVKKRVDAASYCHRFTPRRPSSTWSAVNVRRAGALIAAGRMAPAGLAAFAARKPFAAGRYSYENRPQALAAEHEREFASHPRAWAFFNAQPPGYRRKVAFWVMSAKLEDTRRRRLAALIESSERGERVGQVTGGAAKTAP